MLNLRAENILFGTGGGNPGIEAYGIMSGQQRKILSLAPEQSVYELQAYDSSIVAGTNTGAIYCITQKDSGQKESSFEIQEIDNGAPVIAISFIEASTIVVADTYGQCLLRRLTKDIKPEKLDTRGRTVCALFNPDKRHIIGLAAEGGLLFWNRTERSPLQVKNVPALPEHLMAFIKAVYWPASDVWVWPGRKGAIVFYRWKQNEIHVVYYHSDNVYTIMICGERLLTIGIDGCMKSWHPGTCEPSNTFEVPPGIISGTCWCQDSTARLILINEEGKAVICPWTNMGLGLIKPLYGENYRVVLGPDIEGFKLALGQQKIMRAKELAALISEKIEQQQYGELHPYYIELERLGYSVAAMGLKGQEARNRNDYVKEVKIYNDLVNTIPHEHPGSEVSLARFAELLRCVWQLHKAFMLYRELADRYLDNKSYTDAVQNLSVHIDIVKTGKYVIEADIPLLSLVESATMVGERARGRYLIEAMHPVSCGVVLCASEFVKEYEQFCQTKPQVPKAEEIEFYWLTKTNDIEQITLVIFRNEDSSPFNYIELAMKFLSTRVQTVLAPVILLNADRSKQGKSMSEEQYNAAIIYELKHIRDDCYKGYLEIVGHTINHVARRLITKKQAKSI
jgi:hypothetical protein